VTGAGEASFLVPYIKVALFALATSCTMQFRRNHSLLSGEVLATLNKATYGCSVDEQALYRGLLLSKCGKFSGKRLISDNLAEGRI
jgi:hypothetical protein